MVRGLLTWGWLVGFLALLMSLAACTQASPTPDATPVPVAATPIPADLPSPTPEVYTSVPTPPDANRYALARRLGRLTGEPPALATPDGGLPYSVGRQDAFQLLDLERTQFYTVDAELKLVTAHAYWYVGKGVEVPLDRLQGAALRFEEHIRPTVVSAFGDWWQTDTQGEPRLTIVHAPLRGTAGYYSSADEYPRAIHPASNEHRAIYIDSRALRVGSSTYEAVLAHELQHALHWQQDPGEEAWVNEGLSEVASYAAGHPPTTLSFFREHPQTQLTTWSQPTLESVPHYAASYLFFLYLVAHYGEYNDLKALVGQRLQGIEGVNAYLRGLGYQQTFRDVFKDWVVANVLPQPEGLYAYPVAPPLLPPSTVLRDYGDDRGNVPQFSARYVDLRLPAGPARLDFEGDPQVSILPTDPPSGDHCWWSNQGDNIDSRLWREVDLSGVAQARLSFRAWYDIEDGWDHAYVVASRDEGKTWDILEGRFTNSRNPVGNAFGPALTGKSDGWVQEEVDLSRYAGQKVLVGFEYVTDDVFSGDGLCLDDLAIPQVGLFDDAETPGEWKAEGFVRSTNLLRQQFIVQVLGLKDDRMVFVRDVPLDANNRGSLLVEGFGTTIDVALVVVAPVTERTRQPAAYTVTVSAP
ncbi:MAG: hypothetical protein EXR55_05370 [Dehalococcoidia bacterium]|nr:hypothetical protein [Dehalococcoidia bacterium]